MRLDDIEKKALRQALKELKGEIYLFGSRVDDNKRGGDIDLLVIPKTSENPLKLSLAIQTEFFLICEQRLDVVVYQDTPFCREVLKNAKRLDLSKL